VAELQLRIKADFDQASASFKSLAEDSESARVKIEKYAQGFDDKRVDGFIEKQKFAAAAVTAVRGETAAMEAQQKAYQRQIESLIKSGLDPESGAVNKLRGELEKTTASIEANTRAQNINEGAAKAAGAALAAAAAAAAAAGAALLKMTQDSAEAGDGYAKTARIIGMTAEELQELEYAAKQSGVSSETLTGSLKKLNSNINDAKNGSGALTKALKDTNPALLNQLKGVKSNEEAFNLLMGAVKNAPDEFKKAELAQAAFGKSGLDLILMAEAGTDTLSGLREEARKYGLISNEAARASEEYMDAQGRLKSAFEGAKNELAEGMMPAVTRAMDKVAEFIAGIDDWDKVLRITITAVASLTAAVGIFVTVMKIAPVIQGVVTAINAAGGALAALKVKILAVNAAIAANPVGLIATAIAAAAGIIVGVIGNAISKQKEYTDEFNNTTRAVDNNTRALRQNALQIDQAAFEASRAFDNVNDLFRSYAEMSARIASTQADIRRLQDNGGSQSRINSFRETLEGYMSRLRGYEARLQEIAQLQGQVFINGQIQDAPSSNTRPNRRERERTLIQKLNEEIKLSEKQLNGDRIKAIESFLNQRADLEGAAGQERINAYNRELKRILDNEILNDKEKEAAKKAAEKAITDIKKEEAEKRLNFIRDSLIKIGGTEAQAENVRREQFSQFFEERLAAEDAYRKADAAAEQLAGEARIAWMRGQQELLLQEFKLGSSEYMSALIASNAVIETEERRLSEARIAIKRAEVEAMGGLFGDLAGMADAFWGENVAGAIASRALAAAQAGINSYLAFTQTLADATIPSAIARSVKAASILASGLGAQRQIWAAALPSAKKPSIAAETGGRFIVPDTSPRVDGAGLRVNRNEIIDITPAGRANGGETMQTFNLNINGEVLARAMRKLARAGELPEFQLSGNL
jgi:hypothetical protein